MASLIQLQGRANGTIGHGGGQEPFANLNLPDLAAYVSSVCAQMYAVSGVVTDTNAVGVAGVKLLVTSSYAGPTTPREFTTGADGSYVIDEMSPGDYTVTAVLPGGFFFPATREISLYRFVVSALDQDFGFLGSGSAAVTNLVVIRADQYVIPQGNDFQDGTSWRNAKQSIQAAIDAAPTNGEIWVAGGVYHERLVLRGKRLYGGFGGQEWNRSQQNWRRSPTILDNAPEFLGPLGIALGSAVTLGDLDTNHARLDGLTVTNSQNPGLGGAVYVESSSAPLITHCTLAGNYADGGGAIYCSGFSAPSIVNNLIADNTSAVGGGIYCDVDSAPQLIAGNLILNNTTDDGGGGLSCDGTAWLVANNTVVGNQSLFSGAGGLDYPYGNGTNINNVVAFNSSGIGMGFGQTVYLAGNCVYGNTGGDYLGLSAGLGDLSGDPLFVDRFAGDFHLRAASPCINAGENAAAVDVPSDFDGLPRLARRSVDIGAYELPPPGLVWERFGGEVVLSWPADESRFTLEFTTNLASGEWTLLKAPSTTNGTMQSVTVSNASPSHLFRLIE